MRKSSNPVKNTITAIGAIVVIIVCVYLIFYVNRPKTKEVETTPPQETVKEITGEAYEEEEIDGKKVYKKTEMRKTLNRVKLLKDYGDPTLDNLGKENPFKL